MGFKIAPISDRGLFGYAITGRYSRINTTPLIHIIDSVALFRKQSPDRGQVVLD